MHVNSPRLWLSDFKEPQSCDHKYSRGLCAILAAPKLTGASRLVASNASRLCGAVSVIAPKTISYVYRSALPEHIMVQDISEGAPHSFLINQKVRSVCLGSGGGYDHEYFREITEFAWDQEHINSVILDAEAIKSWAGRISSFASRSKPSTILTPHDGEFRALFTGREDIITGDRIEDAKNAAKLLGVIIVLKGAQTIIACPDMVVVNNNAPACLASAGTGDCLAGIITGLCASGMKPFKAACAAVWIHSRSGQEIGLGLVASDIEKIIPKVLKEMLGK